MQIILVKITLYVTDKSQKNKKITVSFPGKTPLKLKHMPKKLKHLPSVPAASTAGPSPTFV